MFSKCKLTFNINRNIHKLVILNIIFIPFIEANHLKILIPIGAAIKHNSKYTHFVGETSPIYHYVRTYIFY